MCTFAGYALAVLRGPFKNIIFLLIITPILFPGVSLIIPLYKILKDIGLLNNLYGLIFLHSTFMLPLGVFMMRNAFKSIPSSLREVSILEGTSELQIILRVLLPLCIPGLLTVMVFAMYVSWNDYIFAYVFVSTAEKEVLNVALAKIALGGNEFDMKWGSITAGSVVSFIPIIIFFDYFSNLIFHYFFKKALFIVLATGRTEVTSMNSASEPYIFVKVVSALSLSQLSPIK
mgnify:CR=1 FL=1